MNQIAAHSNHICRICGVVFTVTPAVDPNTPGWDFCLSEDCASYDPNRDMDVVFISDSELAEKPVVSIKMLRKRREFQQTGVIK